MKEKKERRKNDEGRKKDEKTIEKEQIHEWVN